VPEKQKIEILIIAILAFAVTMLAPIIRNAAISDLLKMVMKALVYILLVAIPFVICIIMKRPIGALGFKKEDLLKQILIGCGIFAFLASLMTIAVLVLGENAKMLIGSKLTGIGSIIYSIVFLIVFVGMGEEILFRGYFLERFKTLTGSVAWAIILSSILFGAWHFPGGQDFLQVFITAMIGAILGFSMLKFKNCSTLSVVIAHGLYDVFLMVLAYILL